MLDTYGGPVTHARDFAFSQQWWWVAWVYPTSRLIPPSDCSVDPPMQSTFHIFQDCGHCLIGQLEYHRCAYFLLDDLSSHFVSFQWREGKKTGKKILLNCVTGT